MWCSAMVLCNGTEGEIHTPAQAPSRTSWGVESLRTTRHLLKWIWFKQNMIAKLLSLYMLFITHEQYTEIVIWRAILLVQYMSIDFFFFQRCTVASQGQINFTKQENLVNGNFSHCEHRKGGNKRKGECATQVLSFSSTTQSWPWQAYINFTK